jgi:hypothetical protein
MAEERTESQGFFEMLWDCEFCETKALLAKSQRHCAECGGKQNPDKRYFPKEGEAKRVDGHKYEGADKHCPNCEAPMGKLAHNCTNCGAPQDGAKEVRGVVTAAPPPKKQPRWWIPVIIGVLVILGIVFLVRWCNRTEEKQVTIAAHRWERSIGIEKYDLFDREAWDDDVPRGGNVKHCRKKQRSTKKIEDGEDCKDQKVDKKDGTFEVVRKCTKKYRSEPVDDDWCTYSIRDWKEVDRVTTKGSGITPAWPTERLPAETYSEVLGATRRGSKKQTYFLDMTGLEQAQTCDVSEAIWKKYTDNQKVKVQVRSRNGEVECDSL